MPERGKGKFAGYKQVYSDKALPEKFHQIYRTGYTRLRVYFRKQNFDVENPMFAMLAERIASLTATAKYMESHDYVVANDFGLDNPMVLKEFNNLQSTLNRTMEQLMKYTTESLPKKTIQNINKKSISIGIKDISQLSGGELDREIAKIIGGGQAQITDASEGEE